MRHLLAERKHTGTGLNWLWQIKYFIKHLQMENTHQKVWYFIRASSFYPLCHRYARHLSLSVGRGFSMPSLRGTKQPLHRQINDRDVFQGVSPFATWPCCTLILRRH